MKKLSKKQRRIRAKKAAARRWQKEKIQKTQQEQPQTGSLIQANQREIELKMLDGALAGDKQAMDAAVNHLQKCTDPECFVLRSKNQIEQKLLDEMQAGDGYAIKKVQGILDREKETAEDWDSLTERNTVVRINSDGKITHEVIDVLRTDGQDKEVYEATIGYTDEEIADLRRCAAEFEELKRTKKPSEVKAEIQQNGTLQTQEMSRV